MWRKSSQKRSNDSFLESIYNKSYHLLRFWMSENNKLLLRQKDYELQAFKSFVQPNISVHDPLINPPKTKKSKKAKPLNAFNPLNRMSKLPAQAILQASKIQLVQQ